MASDLPGKAVILYDQDSNLRTASLEANGNGHTEVTFLTKRFVVVGCEIDERRDLECRGHFQIPLCLT